VLAEWVRVLKPGGVLRVAVPDFETIARGYLAGVAMPVQGYLMGGHVDADDRHGAIFDREDLHDQLAAAGLVGITPWRSEIKDCAALPVSLNLQGTKPPAVWPKISAVMSVPRLGFMDNLFCAQELVRRGIPLRKFSGAFWGQCLTRGIEQVLEEDHPDYVLTIDYDTIFTGRDVEALLAAAVRHPTVHAIAPLQVSRSLAKPLMTVRGDDGEPVSRLDRSYLDPELAPATTAHFGLTLLQAAALRRLPRPWFHGQPDRDGRWGDDRTDDDVGFWRAWADDGLTLCVASHIAVGHAELMTGRDTGGSFDG